MSARLRKGLQFVGFLSIGVAILAFVFHRQNAAYREQCALDGVPADECSLIGKLAADLATVNYWWLLALLAIFMVSNYFRTVRWQQLIEPLGRRVSLGNAFWSVMIGYFANLGFPRAGEVVRAGVLARYEGVAVERVMGTVVLDRLLDVVCLLAVMGVAFVVQWETLSAFVADARAGAGGGGGVLGYLVLAAATGLLLLGVAWYMFRRYRHVALVRRVSALVAGFADGLRSVARVRNKPALALNTLGIWGCYFLMAYVPFFAFPPTAHLGVDAALMVFVFSALGIVIPSPGGLGSYHLMVIQALAIYNVDGADALSFANILFFTVNLGCNILFGLLGLAVLPMLNAGKRVSLADAAGVESEARAEPA